MTTFQFPWTALTSVDSTRYLHELLSNIIIFNCCGEFQSQAIKADQVGIFPSFLKKIQIIWLLVVLSPVAKKSKQNKTKNIRQVTSYVCDMVP